MDSEAESWQLNNRTLSAPALPKYIIAFSRLLGGFHRDELNRPENFTFHYEGDALVGAIPTDKLLFISRSPMVVLSILIGLLIYCLFWHGINRFSAIIWLICMHHQFFNEFYSTRCDERSAATVFQRAVFHIYHQRTKTLEFFAPPDRNERQNRHTVPVFCACRRKPWPGGSQQNSRFSSSRNLWDNATLHSFYS